MIVAMFSFGGKDNNQWLRCKSSSDTSYLAMTDSFAFLPTSTFSASNTKIINVSIGQNLLSVNTASQLVALKDFKLISLGLIFRYSRGK